MDVERKELTEEDKLIIERAYSDVDEKKITLDEFYATILPVVGEIDAQGMLASISPTEYVDEHGITWHIQY